VLKIVTASLKKQREEPISLHWKTKYDDEVSYPSIEDIIIVQDDHKIDNEEAVSNVADQEESVTEVKGIILDDWVQSENLQNSTEFSNSSTAKVLRASRRNKKPSQ
jgi:hypothetical protein